MVKNLHFCTEELLSQLYEGFPGDIIKTYRTGWVPGFYVGDVVNLNDRDSNNKDSFIRKGKIKWILPLQYKEFTEYHKQRGYRYKKGLKEIKRYNRKFHPEHWFFQIGIKLI